MRSSLRRYIVLLPLLLLAAGRVDAVSIVSLEFAPAAQTVNLGAQATVDINVTDLSGELIGAFDFDVLWDSSLLSLASADFGPSLGGGPFDSFQSDPLSDPGNPTFGVPGVANMSELSLLFDFTGLQNGIDPVTLFSLTFDTLDTGTSSLTFAPGFFGDYLVDDFGLTLITDANTTGSITIERSSVIAEPGVLTLMALGLLLPGFMRRR